MSKISFLKKILKSFGFFVLVIIISSYATFSSDDEEAAKASDSSPLSMTGVAEQLEDVETEIPFETLRQKRLRLWNERLAERAESWGMTIEEYLKKADEYVAYFRRSKKVLYGREDLIPRRMPDDLVAYNAAFSERYGVFTKDSFPMFGINTTR